ncbi:AHL_G0047730.mRNA.1.CDS.1 [Saccharomyces cerevisiae]|nr:AHL_G0047730.mRNA.1.CDS.1 [Saccharomyces cerevisiae]CAI6871440.1 AHL_G0047730.mRNA.1.CDS.1 [Saccharomyces cerevisiae]
MQESKEPQNKFEGCQRISSSSSTLFGGTSFEEPRCGTSQGKEEDAFACNNGDHCSSITNVQEDDFVLPELLPSFEMYENLLSNIPQSSFDTYFPENPPFYEVASRNQSIPSEGESGNDMRILTGDIVGPDNHEVTVDGRRFASGPAESQIRNYDDTKGIPVENIYALPRIKTPIATELYVTKTAPKFGQLPKHESMLREYTSGDIIHGYFTVENKSTKPIKFDMFYLTLEGTTSSKTQSPFGIQKTTERILRMVDMAASWSYNHEDVNTGEDLCGFFDSIDKTSFGLPNSRILNPGDKRKKFFTFKIPNQLLDVTCKHGHFSHSLLPPTLGFDRPSSSHPELSTLKFSESLGYGRFRQRRSFWAREKCLKDLEDFDIEIANRLGMIEKVFSKIERAIPIHKEDIQEANRSDQLSPLRASLFNTGLKNVFLKSVRNIPSSQPDDPTSKTNSEKIGLITIKIKPPSNALPYWCPNLIQKQNVFSMRNRQNQKNWTNLRGLLSVEEREKLENLRLELVCMQAANSIPHDPPEISSLETELICLTTNTKDCKPVRFHSDLLLKKHKYNEIKKIFKEILENIEAYRDEFTKNQTKINLLLADDARASLRNRSLDFSDLMPSSIIKDVQVLANMEANVVVMKNALKTKLVGEKSVPVASSPISSIIPRTSRNKKTSPSNYHHSVLSHRKSNEWNQVSSTEYKRTLLLNIKYNDDFKATIVPSFESCLCSRSYFLRVKLHFDKGVGSAEIDIPVQVKNSFI